MAETEDNTPDPRKLTYEDLQRLADHLFSRGVTTAAPFAEMPDHQAALRLASAALRLLASHKAGFARIAHGTATATVPIAELNNLRRYLRDLISALLNFPLREIAHDLEMASRAADDLRSLRQDIATATDWIGRS